jgi:type IV secretory pathway VirB2 component (pilin)
MAIVHPIFSVLVSRPELVMNHVAGYAALVQEEASSVGSEVAKRVIAGAVAALCMLVFLVLAGVAIMLGAVHGDFHWTLVVVPGVVLVLAVLALNKARQRLPAKAFAELKAQLDADAQVLRTLGGKP